MDSFQLGCTSSFSVAPSLVSLALKRMLDHVMTNAIGCFSKTIMSPASPFILQGFYLDILKKLKPEQTQNPSKFS